MKGRNSNKQNNNNVPDNPLYDGVKDFVKESIIGYAVDKVTGYPVSTIYSLFEVKEFNDPVPSHKFDAQGNARPCMMYPDGTVAQYTDKVKPEKDPGFPERTDQSEFMGRNTNEYNNFNSEIEKHSNPQVKIKTNNQKQTDLTPENISFPKEFIDVIKNNSSKKSVNLSVGTNNKEKQEYFGETLVKSRLHLHKRNKTPSEVKSYNNYFLSIGDYEVDLCKKLKIDPIQSLGISIIENNTNFIISGYGANYITKRESHKDPGVSCVVFEVMFTLFFDSKAKKIQVLELEKNTYKKANPDDKPLDFAFSKDLLALNYKDKAVIYNLDKKFKTIWGEKLKSSISKNFDKIEKSEENGNVQFKKSGINVDFIYDPIKEKQDQLSFMNNKVVNIIKNNDSSKKSVSLSVGTNNKEKEEYFGEILVKSRLRLYKRNKTPSEIKSYNNYFLSIGDYEVDLCKKLKIDPIQSLSISIIENNTNFIISGYGADFTNKREYPKAPCVSCVVFEVMFTLFFDSKAKKIQVLELEKNTYKNDYKKANPDNNPLEFISCKDDIVLKYKNDYILYDKDYNKTKFKVKSIEDGLSDVDPENNSVRLTI